jgi:hypothetical protein
VEASFSRSGALEIKRHFGEIHEVPGVGDLTASADDERGTEESCLFSATGKAESVTRVNPCARPTYGNAIIFGNKFVEMDVDVTEGIVELAVNGFEALGTDENGVGLGEPVDLALRVKEFVDTGFFALVPNFFKPELSEGLVLS